LMKPASERHVRKDNKMFVKVKLQKSAQVLALLPDEIAEFVVLNDFGLSPEEIDGIRVGATQVLMYDDSSFELFPTAEFWELYTVDYAD
jgi:hypothetical protein